MTIPKKFREDLEKMGLDPDKIPIVKEITPDLIKKWVVFDGTLTAFAFRLCPPLIITDEEGNNIEYNSKFQKHEYNLKNGVFITDLSGEKGTKKAKKYFSDFINIMNIIGIPIDYVTDYDILFLVKGEKKVIECGFSNRGLTRGENIKPLKIIKDRFDKLIELVNEIFEKIKEHDLYKDSNVWELLAKGRYHAFHADRFNIFLYHFLFLESSINWMWRTITDSKFDTNPPSKNVRDWTLQIKIDELMMLGIITKNIRSKLHRLRRKRNAIFHVDPNPDKRIITDEDISDSIKISTKIFNKSIDFDPRRLSDVMELRSDIHKILHKPEMTE